MTDKPLPTWRDHEHLTPEHRQWLMRLCDAAQKGCKSRNDAAKLIGITIPELDKWIYFLTCRVSWPPRFDSEVFQKPVKDERPKIAKDAAWQDELLPIEESDALRRQVAEWMRTYNVPVSGVPYACRASAKKVMAFLQGSCCDTFVASALRDMLKVKKRLPRQWEAGRFSISDMRRQREEELLELERRKYGLKRKGRPLSSMPV